MSSQAHNSLPQGSGVNNNSNSSDDVNQDDVKAFIQALKKGGFVKSKNEQRKEDKVKLKHGIMTKIQFEAMDVPVEPTPPETYNLMQPKDIQEVIARISNLDLAAEGIYTFKETGLFLHLLLPTKILNYYGLLGRIPKMDDTDMYDTMNSLVNAIVVESNSWRTALAVAEHNKTFDKGLSFKNSDGFYFSQLMDLYKRSKNSVPEQLGFDKFTRKVIEPKVKDEKERKEPVMSGLVVDSMVQAVRNALYQYDKSLFTQTTFSVKQALLLPLLPNIPSTMSVELFNNYDELARDPTKHGKLVEISKDLLFPITSPIRKLLQTWSKKKQPLTDDELVKVFTS